MTPALLSIAQALVTAPELSSFRIVGGTGVALHIGHRTSVDIDFFSNERVSKHSILRFLKDRFPGNEFFVTEHNVLGEINGVRVYMTNPFYSHCQKLKPQKKISHRCPIC
jgi:hypothetical protein